MNYVVIHKYAEPDLAHPQENSCADCAKCLLAEKTKILDGEDGLLCKAALYDVETLQCFIPKE